ncbi:hypothetical protein HYH02_011308 [Chlamydomonas schloesseri]|uniref:Inositol polyphosphate-related phosphatase domain-containing protein n=1 Tax=Chlamydomonas schloesseri TaxID=2026947 RepID=A0A835TFW7_9CHLO|nr:hypothetical protein HYH02_011308 [Chlamydomonas schloesseri]|eukprot:KAG2437045.1 hypothetical protein HYH02_011308 [Chlamydomonas schloesseri]
MKKLLGHLASKAAALADDIASYNDGRHVTTASARPGPPGAGGGAAGEGHLDPVLEHLLRNVRSRHVRQHFARTPVAEYTRHRNLTIQVATYNVGGKKPHPGIRLDDWLGPSAAAVAAASEGGAAVPRLPPQAGAAAAAAVAQAGGGGGSDVVAVGFQELVPLNAGSVMGVLAGDHVDAWDRCLAAHLNGEEWAAQRYGTLGPAAPGTAAAAAAAAAMLDAKWQGVPPPRGQLEGGGGEGGGGGGEDSTYVQVASKQLVGVYLSVWVRRSLLGSVHGVQVTTVATGFGGYLGNKGAVAARLRLADSSLVFVAAHLTAGEAEGDEAKRNADVADILRRAAFSGGGLDGAGAVPMTSSAAAAVSASLGPGHWPAWPCGITDHDLVIWVGDLNYRLAVAPTPPPQQQQQQQQQQPGAAAGGAVAAAALQPGGAAVAQQRVPGAGAGAGAGAGGSGGLLTDAEARAAIRGGQLDVLLAADQLHRERAAGRVFKGWHEGKITFPPTYKYKVGTHTYNGDDAASTSASYANLAQQQQQQQQQQPGSSQSQADLAVSEDADSVSVSVSGPSAVVGPDAESHKRRTPAWCDRVLWWTRAGSGSGSGSQQGAAAGPGGKAATLQQLGYWRGELAFSDHRPVSSLFSATVVAYDRPKIESLLEAALRAVDLMQQSLRPKVTVEPVVLEAGDWVAPGRPVRLRITLVNTGPVEAIWHFIPPPNAGGSGGGGGKGGKAGGGGGGGGKFGLDDETPPLPPWLTATPAEGVLAAGATCELGLTVLVEGGPGGSAAALSADDPAAAAAGAGGRGGTSAGRGGGSLDCIVILRIEDSGDKFISIGGRYCQSFLGMPLAALLAPGRSGGVLAVADAEQLAAELGVGPLLLGPLAPAPAAPAAAAAAAPQTGAGAAAPALPREVAALLAALSADGGAALRTPGLLVDSAPEVAARAAASAEEEEQLAPVPAATSASAAAAAVAAGAGITAADADDVAAAAAAARQPVSRAGQRALLRALEALRLPLDAGAAAVPPGAAPHDVAALLLLWCGQLPQPLISAAAADAAASAPPVSPADAAALLRRHCDAASRGVLAALLPVLRSAVAAAAVAAASGQGAAQLAGALSAWWLPPLGAGASPDAGANRRRLIRMLLEPAAAGESLV